MRVAQRRMVGVGGAAFAAIGATLLLAGVASAHTPDAKPGCADDGHATILITAKQYKAPDGDNTTPNSITVTVDGSDTPVFTTKFGVEFSNSDNKLEIDGTKEHDVNVHFFAFDDQRFTTDISLHTTVCPQPKPSSPPPSSSSTVPPPPSSTTNQVVVPPASTTPKKTKTAAAELPNTGVSATMPLAIGGALVLVGGGLLFGMRYSARRRHSS